MLAAIELFFQAVVCFAVRGVLLAGGNQRGDPALQFRVLIHGQGTLPDKGTALKHLTRYTQQRLAQILSGYAGYGGSRVAVGAGKIAHGHIGALGVADNGIALRAVGHIQTSMHGAAVPRRIAVLVGQRAALAGR